MSGGTSWREVVVQSRQLSDQKLLQVVALIEKLPTEQRPEHVLDAMRPRLAKLRPPRVLTAQRLLFNPVEDLFDPPVSYRRKIGRLSRRTIPACWNIVSQMCDPRLLNGLQEDIKVVDTRNAAAVNALGRRLWPAASAAMRKALELAGRDHKSSLQLFGRDEDTQRQVADFADVLELGFEIEDTKAQLPPKPIEVLSDAQAQVLRDMIAKLGTASMVQARVFVLVIAARMIKPGILLETLSELKLNCTPHERDQLVKECASTVVANLVRESLFLKDTKDNITDPLLATAHAKRLVEGFASIQQAVGTRMDTSRIEGVAQAKREIASFILDSVVGKADQALHAALKGPVNGEEARSAKTSDAQQEEAENVARSLRDCAQMSDAVGIRREVGSKLENICQGLEQRFQETGLRPSEREERLISSVRLIELIQGPDAAERVLMENMG